MATKIIAHQNTRVGDGTLLGNSYEELGVMLRKGFGISVHLFFSQDGKLIAASGANLPPFHKEDDTKISESTVQEIRTKTFKGNHLSIFTELLMLFRMFLKMKLGGNTFLVLQLDTNINSKDQLELLAQSILTAYPSKILIITTENQAQYLHAQYPILQLACPITTQEEASKFLSEKKEAYSWMWLEAIEHSIPEYRNFFIQCKKRGFLTACSFLSEKEKELLEIIALKPDLFCSNYPEKIKGIISQRTNFIDNFISKMNQLHPYTLKQQLLQIRKNIFLALLEATENRMGKIITFNTRPLYARDITQISDPLIAMEPYAIMLQGALLQKNNFTLETVRMYKKVYQGATIIVSTWEDENRQYLETLGKEGVELVLSKKPEFYGPANINLQIISTNAGLKKAREMGAEYVLKTRTDQRMYNKNIFESMINLINYFPPSERSGQHKRLLFMHGFPKYQPYFLPDMFIFGDIHDVLFYWDIPLVEKNAEYAYFAPETYLVTHFLQRKGWELEWSIEAMWRIYRECIVTMDLLAIDLFWYKYDYHNEHRELREYRNNPTRDFLAFHEWFNIFSNMENKQILPEQDMFLRWTGFKTKK